MRIYLDHASTTHLVSESKIAMQSAMDEVYTNPSSLHENGRKAKALVEQARKEIAQQIGAEVQEIIFNSGGTEGDNHALQIAIENLGVQRIITSQLEHKAVLEPLDYWIHRAGIQVEYIAYDAYGKPDYRRLERLLDQNIPTLVSLMWVNNELGIITDLKELSLICEKYKAYLHTDAVQGLGKLALNLKELQVDFLSGSAHKFGGPKGVGFFYINKKIKIKTALIKGGGQERGMRGGTHNVIGIVGMSAALQSFSNDFEKNKAEFEELTRYWKNKLNHLELVEWNSPIDTQQHYPGILNFHLKGVRDTSLLLFKLDLAGISISAGSACNSGSLKPSHVIQSLFPERSHEANLRVSLSVSNSTQEADEFVAKLVKAAL